MTDKLIRSKTLRGWLIALVAFFVVLYVLRGMLLPFVAGFALAYFVITSYSIHYTKLYEALRLARLGRLGAEAVDEAVITSYSIHYTKLYDQTEV